MPPSKTDTQKLIDSMLQALESPSKALTKWEENFLESISEQYQTRGTLSDRQLEILDRIYTEKTS